jgi:hypothetical protein
MTLTRRGTLGRRAASGVAAGAAALLLMSCTAVGEPTGPDTAGEEPAGEADPAPDQAATDEAGEVVFEPITVSTGAGELVLTALDACQLLSDNFGLTSMLPREGYYLDEFQSIHFVRTDTLGNQKVGCTRPIRNDGEGPGQSSLQEVELEIAPDDGLPVAEDRSLYGLPVAFEDLSSSSMTKGVRARILTRHDLLVTLKLEMPVPEPFLEQSAYESSALDMLRPIVTALTTGGYATWPEDAVGALDAASLCRFVDWTPWRELTGADAASFRRVDGKLARWVSCTELPLFGQGNFTRGPDLDLDLEIHPSPSEAASAKTGANECSGRKETPGCADVIAGVEVTSGQVLVRASAKGLSDTRDDLADHSVQLPDRATIHDDLTAVATGAAAAVAKAKPRLDVFPETQPSAERTENLEAPSWAECSSGQTTWAVEADDHVVRLCWHDSGTAVAEGEVDGATFEGVSAESVTRRRCFFIEAGALCAGPDEGIRLQDLDTGEVVVDAMPGRVYVPPAEIG